eukprot:658388-Pelagomonas_calceolata.AAC.2
MKGVVAEVMRGCVCSGWLQGVVMRAGMCMTSVQGTKKGAEARGRTCSGWQQQSVMRAMHATAVRSGRGRAHASPVSMRETEASGEEKLHVQGLQSAVSGSALVHLQM